MLHIFTKYKYNNIMICNIKYKYRVNILITDSPSMLIAQCTLSLFRVSFDNEFVQIMVFESFKYTIFSIT